MIQHKLLPRADLDALGKNANRIRIGHALRTFMDLEKFEFLNDCETFWCINFEIFRSRKTAESFLALIFRFLENSKTESFCENFHDKLM